MARVIRRLAPLACAAALLAAPAAAHAARAYLWQWQPDGEEAGPQLILQDKVSVTGKFGVSCGRSWLFSYYGGGEHPPFGFDQATGAISGTEDFPADTVGIGSSYRAAEVNFFDFKSAGPVVMTLSAQGSQAAAVGTLGLKLYSYTRAHGHGRHRVKAKKVLSASCQIAFDAPNYYAEAPPGTVAGEK